MSDFFSIKYHHEFATVCSGIPKYPPKSETQRNCAEIWLNLIVCKQENKPSIYQECFKNFCAEKFGHRFVRWEGIWWNTYVFYLLPSYSFPIVLLSASQNRISAAWDTLFCHILLQGCSWQQKSHTQKAVFLWFLKNVAKPSFSNNTMCFSVHE